ncbi:Thioredoxin [Alteripontixanthobacter maritimus]|uniref:Thioredoxin n=1 Tax=Alteripontixanthobacter maritimus TaxID=2161824 RepID=A0A369Q2H4_9SPHN|nr:tetratricopeptide repeat protein [Alteripontixanthobacter maritimus]RDC58964.1 Thioredoxin [Alteripontixanthobacter maritimus]
MATTPPPGGPPPQLSIEEQKAVETFRTNVVDPSMTKLVILDFWAEWCGPCKALTPTLEKVAAEYADKGVVLAKINVDEEKFIAGQFQVQSIPTVYAMFQGQPVADLTSARTESQLKEALDQILAQLPIGDAAAGGAPDGSPADAAQGGAPGAEAAKPNIDQFLTMGEEVLAGGDAERAAGIFQQVVQMAPDNVAAQTAMVRALVAAGRTDEARSVLDVLEPAMGDDPLVKTARSTLDLAGTQVDPGELDTLRAAAVERPADMEASYAFAEAAYASGERDEAADTLLSMVEKDREWNEGAARTKLLQIFEAVGLEDAWVKQTRRRLSEILFG